MQEKKGSEKREVLLISFSISARFVFAIIDYPLFEIYLYQETFIRLKFRHYLTVSQILIGTQLYIMFKLFTQILWFQIRHFYFLRIQR